MDARGLQRRAIALLDQVLDLEPEACAAGYFEAQGNLVNEFYHFTSSGTNRVRLNGTAAQTADIYCLSCTVPPDPIYQSVEVANPAGVTFTGWPARVGGDLTVEAGAAATFDNDGTTVDGSLELPGTLTLNQTRTLNVTGALLLRSTGILNNNGTMTVGSCTQEAGSTVNGTNPCP